MVFTCDDHDGDESDKSLAIKRCYRGRKRQVASDEALLNGGDERDNTLALKRCYNGGDESEKPLAIKRCYNGVGDDDNEDDNEDEEADDEDEDDEDEDKDDEDYDLVAKHKRPVASKSAQLIFQPLANLTL